MKKENDIVDDIFTRVKTILGDEFQGQIVVQLEDAETRIRQDWEGVYAYVSTRKNREKKYQKALLKIKTGVSVKTASECTGVSVRQIYRLLRRK